MLKFIIPAVLVFLTVLYWEKVNEYIYKKTSIKINNIFIVIIICVLGAIFTLLYF